MKSLRYLLVNILFLCILAMGISAAATECIPQKTTVKAGEKFYVTVKLDSAQPVLSMGATPVYSEDVFEIVSGEWLCKGALLSDFNKKTGDGVIMFTDVKEQDGEIFKFTLKVKDSAPEGSYNIKTNVIINYNSDDGAIHCIAKNCSVEVISDKPAETAVTTVPETASAETTPETTAEETAPATTPETTGADTTTDSPEATDTGDHLGGYIPNTPEGVPVTRPQAAQPDVSGGDIDKQTVIWIAVAVAGCIILGIVFGRASKK